MEASYFQTIMFDWSWVFFMAQGQLTGPGSASRARLSRPAARRRDREVIILISATEIVIKRLQVLNKYFPRGENAVAQLLIWIEFNNSFFCSRDKLGSAAHGRSCGIAW